MLLMDPVKHRTGMLKSFAAFGKDLHVFKALFYLIYLDTSTFLKQNHLGQGWAK